MDYLDLRFLHVALAAISLSGLILRWAWMALERPILAHRLTRTLPHLLDTLFLASGIWLTFLIRQFPFTDAWLTAKLLGLIIYIILGSLALKRAATRRGRIGAMLAAIAVFAWIVSVALLRNPRGFLLPLN